MDELKREARVSGRQTGGMTTWREEAKSEMGEQREMMREVLDRLDGGRKRDTDINDMRDKVTKIEDKMDAMMEMLKQMTGRKRKILEDDSD